jgi:hypothetical protein
MESLRLFRNEFRKKLLAIHWRQWTSLGISSTHERESKSAIDLEALLLSTMHLGTEDKRLLTIALEWLLKNREWINLSRVKRIGGHYLAVQKPLNRGLISHEAFSLLQRYLKSSPEPEENDLHQAHAAEKAGAYTSADTLKEAFHIALRGKAAVEPNLQDPCLLQLYFRGIFGINARAELMLYLLLCKHGNSNSIAKEIGFDQKIVYRLLERWTMAGLVEKTQDKNYQLSPGSGMTAIASDYTLPRYTNWISGFATLNRIYAAMKPEQLSDDKYALSSYFRDILPDARTLARSVNLSLPDGRSHAGAAYFGAFSSEIIKVLEKL